MEVSNRDTSLVMPREDGGLFQYSTVLMEPVRHKTAKTRPLPVRGPQ